MATFASMDDRLNDPPLSNADADNMAYARAHWPSILGEIPDAQLVTVDYAIELAAAGRVD